MAKPPPDPTPSDDDDDFSREPAPSVVTAPPPEGALALNEPRALSKRDDGPEVIFRSTVRRKDIVLNVVVGTLLSAAVGYFLLDLVLERPWIGMVMGVLLVLLGARGRIEKGEVEPIEILPALERKRAIELHFESAPTRLVDSKTAKFVDAEATGNGREGFVHWVVVRGEAEGNFRLRVPNRAEAIRISKRLRVVLEIPPAEELGEDELGGEDYPPREDEP